MTHPLLLALGRDLRELQRSLAVAGPVDEHLPAASPRPETLLGWLQSDLADDRADRSAGRRVAPGDRSVQVHACHGPARQVDVLREVLLGLLADDPTLEPRDILVMCPDIEAYAPLVSAGFGLGDVEGGAGFAHPAHRLRVRLADRALAQTNPLLAVAARLLDIAGGRARASEVLDLAHAGPVRQRFAFTDDDLQQLTSWVESAGIRWAFDADHRAVYGLADYVQNTWRFGLDRVLTGVAVSEDARMWVDRTLPLDDVGSTSIDRAGRVAEYVDRLRAITDDLVGSHSVEHWLTTLSEGIAALTAVPPGEEWQVGQVQRELAAVRVGAAAGTAGGSTTLRLPDVRALVTERLGGRPTRANFRTGTLTVCTMVPMRSVPHRVVCLLGLDDGVYPRIGASDGDDILARDPLTGERDVRSEDRQLMLDAVAAATEHLVVTYTGANETSGQPRPPAVPLGELLDALDVTAPGARDRVVVRHPLQPFDPRNVTPGALGPDGPFTFDPAALAGARAAAGPRVPAGDFLEAPLPPLAPGDVELEGLIAFLRHPVKEFLRSRLDVALPFDVDEVTDGLSVEIDKLTEWGVGDRLLRDMTAGIDPGVCRDAEWRRGVLPPGRLGWRLLNRITEQVRPLAVEAHSYRQGAARTVDVDVDLGSGRRLRGTVNDVYRSRLVAVGYSRLGPKQRLESWVSLLALSAADPDHNWTARTIGRPARGNGTTASALGPLDASALGHLRDLVDLYDRGMCEPLPLPSKTSYAFAVARRTRGDDAECRHRATMKWASGRYDGEDADPAHARAFGARAPIERLLGPPPPGEVYAGESTRLGALAMRVWSPMFAFETGSI